jgi:hypothetical protein
VTSSISFNFPFFAHSPSSATASRSTSLSTHNLNSTQLAN